VVLNEDLKVWKGEPFEQALAYSYIAAQYASQGSWDNVRAAASGAMFHLRDFGAGPDGRPLDTQEVVERDNGSDQLPAYRVEESDFALGHLLNGIANQQIGRMDEAQAHYKQAVTINPQLAVLASDFHGGAYNTILMVDFGQGPRKIGTGPDNAISAFEPVTPSDDRPLVVSLSGDAPGLAKRVPVVCDVNAMARDHRWNNLQDMRMAKSAIGTGLMVAGGTVAAVSNDSTAQLVGLGVLLAGAVSKAGAHADTRYCEALPQRVYLVPLTLKPGDVVALQVQGHPASRMTVNGLGMKMSDAKVQFRYVRMLENDVSHAWAVSDRVVYSNPWGIASTGVDLPYILGGHSVLPPSREVMAIYQKAGYLRDMTFNQLRDLYLAEGITWEASPDAWPGLHVLEGGKSLAAPWPGTAGYQRLFCQIHQPYHPVSSLVKKAAAREAQALTHEANGSPALR
jgi:hypothetical protein